MLLDILIHLFDISRLTVASILIGAAVSVAGAYIADDGWDKGIAAGGGVTTAGAGLGAACGAGAATGAVCALGAVEAGGVVAGGV